MTDTPLDRAASAAARADAPPDAQARLYALLLETALCVPVKAGDDRADRGVRPQVFEVSDGAMALAFDDDARMAGFFEGPTEYVSLPGRALTALLAEAGLGMGLNLGEAPSAMVLDAATVAWLAAEMGGTVDEDAPDVSGPLVVSPPAGATPGLLAALAERLALFPGLASGAWLARLGPPDAPGRLTALLVPAPAAARAAQGLAAALGRAAAPHAPAGETVAVAVLNEGHALQAPARRLGAPLHAPPQPPAAPKPAGAPSPPRLR